MTIIRQQIITTLDKLGIKHAGKPNSQNWLSCLCVFHPDNNLGNAFINLDSSVFYCNSCGAKHNLYSIVKKQTGLTQKKDIYEYIGLSQDASYYETLHDITKQITKPTLQKLVKSNAPLSVTPFDPNEYAYTRERGITKDFLDTFTIGVCTSGYYTDYMIIPIVHKKKHINTFEARKLKQYESLKVFFKSDFSELRLTRFLQEYINDHKLNLKYNNKKKRFVLTENNNEITNPLLVYLMRPKVLYPKGSLIDSTIWNYDTIDFDKDLFIREGITGLGKIYKRFGRNISSIFGATITRSQIDILRQGRGRKILIPDNDKAGLGVIQTFSEQIPNSWVIPVESDDTHNCFMQELEKPIIETTRYLIKRSGILPLTSGM